MLKNLKNSITLFYIALILVFKVIGLHSITHHSEDEEDYLHCEVCHITSAVSFIPLLETKTPVLPQETSYFLKNEFSSNDLLVVYSNKYLSSYLHTRPPPKVS